MCVVQYVLRTVRSTEYFKMLPDFDRHCEIKLWNRNNKCVEYKNAKLNCAVALRC
jgi:hypothetical protein